MLMSDMKESQSCKIVKINCDKALYRRLTELGVTEGQTVKCKNICLCKSPIAYEVCSGKLAIRKSDAAAVEVTEV